MWGKLQIIVYIIKQLTDKLNHTHIMYSRHWTSQKNIKKSCYYKISLALYRKATLHTVKGKEPVF